MIRKRFILLVCVKNQGELSPGIRDGRGGEKVLEGIFHRCDGKILIRDLDTMDIGNAAAIADRNHLHWGGKAPSEEGDRQRSGNAQGRNQPAAGFAAGSRSGRGTQKPCPEAGSSIGTAEAGGSEKT